MAYTATYSSTDVAPATSDLIVNVVAALVGFGSLIAIVLLYKWLKGRRVNL